MKRFIYIFFVTLILQAQASCNHDADGNLSLQPASLDLTPPSGPPKYQQGFKDGCESAANAYSGQFYKFIKAFKYKFDPKLRNDRIYYQIWKDAFLYCAIYWEGINSGNI